LIPASIRVSSHGVAVFVNFGPGRWTAGLSAEIDDDAMPVVIAEAMMTIE